MQVDADRLAYTLGQHVERTLMEADQLTSEEAHMAFNGFYRAGRPGGPSGTGLGLTIVRQIVLQHCGEIVLDTEAGRGTSVTLYLPAAA